MTMLIQVLRQLGRIAGHDSVACAGLALVAEASHFVQMVEVLVVVTVDTA